MNTQCLILCALRSIIQSIIHVLGDKMKMENEFEEIIQYARDYITPPERERVGCRAIVIKDNKVLLSLEERKNVYMSPGGGVEEGETLEECVVRELGEEAGYIIKAIKPFVKVKEYCFETLWINNYFICEIIGQCERKLTESEEYNRVKPVWVDLDKALEIFGDYESKEIDQGSLYLREYTVLKKLNSK